MRCYSLIYVLCSIVLPACVWTSSNIFALRAEMTPFERSFKPRSRYNHLRFSTPLDTLKTRLLNISDQHLLKIMNYGVHNSSRMCLSDLLEYRRPPSSEGVQGLTTFANKNSRMFPKQAYV